MKTVKNPVEYAHLLPRPFSYTKRSEAPTMTGTIEVTVKVYLQVDLDSDSQEFKEIVQAIIDGEVHPLVDNVELVKFETEDE